MKAELKPEETSVVFVGEKLKRKNGETIVIVKVTPKMIFYRKLASIRTRRCSHIDMGRWIQEGIFQGC